jgi:hypothetical protein
VRIRLDDFIYDIRDPVAFLRADMLLRRAFRGDAKTAFKSDRKAVLELRGGRSMADLEVPNVKLVSAWGKHFPGIQKLKDRVGMLLAEGDEDMKKILEAYRGHWGWLFDDTLWLFKQGI